MLPVTQSTRRLPASLSSRGASVAGEAGGSGGSYATGTPAAGFGSLSEPELMRRSQVSTTTAHQSSRSTGACRSTRPGGQAGGVRAPRIVEAPGLFGPTAGVVDADAA